METTTDARQPGHLATRGCDIAAQVASWRYTGPSTPWGAIVGHEAQVRRCRELIERLRRPEEDLVRLGESEQGDGDRTSRRVHLPSVDVDGRRRTRPQHAGHPA